MKGSSLVRISRSILQATLQADMTWELAASPQFLGPQTRSLELAPSSPPGESVQGSPEVQTGG